MRKILAFLVACTLSLGLLAGCEQQEYQDGTYYAEFEDFDARGYKDFLEVTVEGGAVTLIVYNAFDKYGSLKSEDEQYSADMEAVQNNYPAQVNSTLINQYYVSQDIDKIDAVAGATYSTDCFLNLFRALEANIYNGDTEPIVVENTPMR